jgi:hypothetical protein
MGEAALEVLLQRRFELRDAGEGVFGALIADNSTDFFFNGR